MIPNLWFYIHNNQYQYIFPSSSKKSKATTDADADNKYKYTPMLVSATAEKTQYNIDSWCNA